MIILSAVILGAKVDSAFSGHHKTRNSAAISPRQLFESDHSLRTYRECEILKPDISAREVVRTRLLLVDLNEVMIHH